MKNLLILILIPVLFLISCRREKISPELVMNEFLNLPSGSFQVDEAKLLVDESIKIDEKATQTVTTIKPGELKEVEIDFSSPKGNVTHAGLRFGKEGKTWLIPILGIKEQKTGKLKFQMQLPYFVCDRVKSICHNVSWFNFAVVSKGDQTYTISRANIKDVILGCGACNDASCRGVAFGCNCTDNIEELSAEYQEIILKAISLIGVDDVEYCNIMKNTVWPFYLKMIDCLINSSIYSKEEKEVLKEAWDALITFDWEDYC